MCLCSSPGEQSLPTYIYIYYCCWAVIVDRTSHVCLYTLEVGRSSECVCVASCVYQWDPHSFKKSHPLKKMKGKLVLVFEFGVSNSFDESEPILKIRPPQLTWVSVSLCLVTNTPVSCKKQSLERK